MNFTNDEFKIIDTKIISIGSSCLFKLYKKKFFSEKNIKETLQTQFFDWLLCSYPNNIKILNSEQPEHLFNYKNWSINKRRLKATLNLNIDYQTVGKVNGLIISLHDLKADNEYSLQEDVVDKYIRRHKRIKKFLQETENIILIYSTFLEDNECNEILKCIKNLTQKKVILVCFYTLDNDTKTNYISYGDFFKINFNVLHLYNLSPDNKYFYHLNNINLAFLFKILLDIYKKAFE